MLDFINYLKKEKVIRDLKQFYKVDKNKSKETAFLDKIIEGLHNNLDILNSDLISNLYEKARNREEKKKLGEFYTPISIVNYILDAVHYNNKEDLENKKIIDISCGSGSFIVQVVRRIVERWIKKLNITELSELSITEAKRIIENIQNNINGVDVNPVAVILCQVNIQLTLFCIFNLIRKADKNYHFPKFKIVNRSALEIPLIEAYDFVIGNPPYLFLRDIPQEQRKIIDKKNLETNTGQYDYYQIFMEMGIRLLKNHGNFGYIVPDSLLALSNRKVIRKYMYDNAKIKELYNIGPKFEEPIVSNTIVILQKETDVFEREMNLIQIKIAGDEDSKPKSIIQKFIQDWDYNFLIHLNEVDILILKHLNDKFPKMSEFMNHRDYKIILSRGVELGKEGEIIYCEKCDKYQPLPKKELRCAQCNSKLSGNSIENIIHKKDRIIKTQDFKPYIYSINQYLIKDYRYIDISKKGINYKDLEIYKDRIIIRQMSQNNRICATYDKSSSLTSQSFYNLKIVKTPVSEFDNYYLLGIINSSLLSYFFIKSFGSYKKLFPRILIEKIKNLPIKIPISEDEREKAKKIRELVKVILNENEIIQPYLKVIDSLVFDLYKITKNNQNYILNYMNTLYS
jgi:methylase of polypeptide subunit release factors